MILVCRVDRYIAICLVLLSEYDMFICVKKTKQKAEGLKSPKEAKTNLILDNLELINAKVGKIRKEEDLACVPCNATAS